ncbi:UNVERIFIED_CONTAM: phosphoglucomutase [Brevibacillus sp. OAP136]
MSYMQEYYRWLAHGDMSTELKEELEHIRSLPAEIEDRFHKELEFGTAGLRGLIGAGTNRMNRYTVRKAALGFAQYICRQGEAAKRQGVVIAYDSRLNSYSFADEIMQILVQRGISVWFFQELAPTPLLSFAIRYYGAFAGIVVTASHNPPEYNGLKVYTQYGGQMTDHIASEVYRDIQQVGDTLLMDTSSDWLCSSGRGEIRMIGDELFAAYGVQVERLLVQRQLIESAGDELCIVYTPLHGTGKKVVSQLLANSGFRNVYLVSEQAEPDSRFPTVMAPNPEDPAVFESALRLAQEKQADLVIATDPDADRLGVMVKTGDGFRMLNGNQLGVLLLHYRLDQLSEKGQLPSNGRFIKTIVTSDLGEKIANKYKVVTENTLTGFKYIGEKMEAYEQEGTGRFLFGYEESFGYLAGDFVRDKDAVQIAAIVAEMVLVYKRAGKDLFRVLEEIYVEFGYYTEELLSVTLLGKQGQELIQEQLASLRQNLPTEIGGIQVRLVEDYKTGQKINRKTSEMTKLPLPPSNVIKLIMVDGSWLTIRPSGTEPKMKVYLSANAAQSEQDANEKLQRLKAGIKQLIRLT